MKRLIAILSTAALVLVAGACAARPPTPPSSDCEAPAAPRVNWSGCDKSFAQLIGVDLSDADLSGTDFWRADLSGADLAGADMSNAVVSYGFLSGADLAGADLSDSELYFADLDDADLSATNLDAAGLNFADLSGATGLPVGDPQYYETTCPDGSVVSEPDSCAFTP